MCIVHQKTNPRGPEASVPFRFTRTTKWNLGSRVSLSPWSRGSLYILYLLRQTAALPGDKGPLCVTMPKELMDCIQWSEPGQLVCLFPVKWSFPRPRVDLGWQGGIPVWTPADLEPPWTLCNALGQAVRGHKFPACTPSHMSTEPTAAAFNYILEKRRAFNYPRWHTNTYTPFW